MADVSYRFHYRPATTASKPTIPRGVENESGDLISFLAVAHCHGLDIAAITWDVPLGGLGKGATARIDQSDLSLRWSLAFKRPLTASQPRELSKEYRVLMSEIMVLCNAATRNHPNIVTLEGVCWDIRPQTDEIWPVMIFEKAQEGDLETFMASDVGQALKFPQRLQICQDVAVALMNLHRYAIIHGDINPRNVLVFKDKANFFAKLSDFGYSALMARDHTVDIAKTRPWHAPESEYTWSYNFDEAKKTDIYSFGILCFWILFCDTSIIPHNELQLRNHSSYRWIAELRKNGGVKAVAVTRIQSVEALDPSQAARLRHFFDACLSDDPLQRELHPDDLFHDYQQYGGKVSTAAPDFIKANAFTTFWDPPDQPYAALFQMSKIWSQAINGDFRLWKSIFEGLKAQANFHVNETCRLNASFQLAFCYRIGFGCDRCDAMSSYWLIRSGKCADDLKTEVEFMQADKGPWHTGIARELGPAPLEDVYSADCVLIRAQKVYERAIADLEDILTPDHTVMLRLKSVLALILDEQGRYHEAEALLQATLKSLTKRESLLGIVEAMKATFCFLGRFEQLESSSHEEKALWDELNPKSSLAFWNTKGRRDAVILRDLVVAYSYLGKDQLAESAVLEQIELCKKMYGDTHRSTLTSIGNLASLYTRQPHRTQEARQLLLKAISTAEKSMGKDDIDVLRMKVQLSWAYSTRKEQKEAEALAISNLEACQRILGHSHIETVDALDSLAYNMNEQGRLQETLKLRTTSLQINLDTLGADHFRTGRSTSALAEIYFRLARWDDGERLKAQAVEIYSKSFGEHHRETVTAAKRLADIRRKKRLLSIVTQVVPENIILRVVSLIEATYAWMQRTLYHYT